MLQFSIPHLPNSTASGLVLMWASNDLTLSVDRPYKSESDVCRRQILTYKDGPRIEKNKYF